jgi:hypothetical protein
MWTGLCKTCLAESHWPAERESLSLITGQTSLHSLRYRVWVGFSASVFGLGSHGALDGDTAFITRHGVFQRDNLV